MRIFLANSHLASNQFIFLNKTILSSMKKIIIQNKHKKVTLNYNLQKRF